MMTTKETQPTTASERKVRHRFSVWVDVPAVSGDGWNRYPDYSADEVARMLRRALHDRLEFDAVVEHVETTKVDDAPRP